MQVKPSLPPLSQQACLLENILFQKVLGLAYYKSLQISSFPTRLNNSIDHGNLFASKTLGRITQFLEQYPGGESNSHAFRHTILSRACLPFHHPGDTMREFYLKTPDNSTVEKMLKCCIL